MTEQDEVDKELKLIVAKLDVVRNFLVVANDGMRQQQSAMLDEVVMVMRDIRVEIGKWIKEHTK